MIASEPPRRRFLKRLLGLGASLAGTVGASTVGSSARAAPGPPAAEPDDELRIRSYRELGSTGFRMSDISMGGAEAGPKPATYLEALRLGINYFDTSPDYFSGENERVIGRALAEWKGRREDVWITTKMCTTRAVTGHLPWDATKDEYLEVLRGSLERLGLEHVDCWMLHGLGGSPFHQAERFESPALWQAVAEAKSRGWTRFFGVSSHGPFKKMQHLERVVDSGKADMLLTAYSHLGGKGGSTVDGMRALFAKAHARGMGIVTMKTVPRASHAQKEELEGALEAEAPYAHLCFRWVLETPGVSGLIKSMRSVGEVRAAVAASGTARAPGDDEALARYGVQIHAETCRIGCGDCLDSCPAGVEVPTLLRFGSYFEDYGRERQAMELYRDAAGHEQLEACVGCAAPCVAGCSYGLDVPRLLSQADRLLHLPARGAAFKLQDA